MWATKVNNIKDKEEPGNKRFGSSGSMMQEHGSFTMLNDRLDKLTQTVEQFIGDMKTWKKVMDEDAKSRKVELKNCLKIQKEQSYHVKSYLSIKKKLSAVERKFEMVYGKKFFDRKE